jgi:hypothetical protein
MNSYKRILNILIEQYKSAEKHAHPFLLKGGPKGWGRRTSSGLTHMQAQDLRTARLEKQGELSDAPASEIPGSEKSANVRLARKAPLRLARRGGYR